MKEKNLLILILIFFPNRSISFEEIDLTTIKIKSEIDNGTRKNFP